jgi:hypothetical protein
MIAMDIPTAHFPSALALRRRRVLQSILGTGLAVGHFPNLMSQALAKGDMPTVPGINQLTGKVTVNGRDARVGTPVAVGDKVVTGKASQAVIVLDKDAYLIRENTQLELAGNGSVLERLRIASGQMLAVFGKGRPRSIQTRNATIGIRGTGAYVEAHDGRVYLCLCYGEANVDLARGAPIALKTLHHERPLWLYDDRSEAAPFLNHKDSELEMLEALFDREPPFKGMDLPRYG